MYYSNNLPEYYAMMWSGGFISLMYVMPLWPNKTPGGGGGPRCPVKLSQARKLVNEHTLTNMWQVLTGNAKLAASTSLVILRVY
jgi:hypothetical protein